MEPVSKAGGSTPPATSRDVPGEARKPEGQGEFEKLIEQKSATQEGSRLRGAGSERTTRGRDGEGIQKFETARGTEHGVQLLHEQRDSRGGEGSHDGGSGESGRDDSSSSQRRMMAGDVSIGVPQFQAPFELRPVETVQSPQPVSATIQTIADQIVDAAQIRMQPGGATEVRLELNMGSLGNMSVELHRTADGQLKIDFQAVTAAAQDMLRSNMSDLTSRLEAKGLNLKEINLQTLDQTPLKWEPQGIPTVVPSASAQAGPMVPPQGSGAADWHGQRGSEQQPKDDDRRRRDEEHGQEDE